MRLAEGLPFEVYEGQEAFVKHTVRIRFATTGRREQDRLTASSCVSMPSCASFQLQRPSKGSTSK